MNVLEVYGSFLPKQGGVQRHIHDLCTCLTKRRHKPLVIAWNPSKPVFEVIDGVKICRFRIPFLLRILRYPMIFYLFLRIAHLVRKYDIDVIHAHDYIPALASVLAGLSVRKPVVVTFHLPIWSTTYFLPWYLFPLSLFEQILKKCLVNYAVVIICVSKFTCRETMKLGFPSSKLKVIYNWMTFLPRCSTSNLNNVLKKFGLNRRPFILSVGRLVDSQKGFSMLIHALNLLANKAYDIDLAIVGDGPDKKRLIECSAKLGIGDRVHLLSHISDLDLACLYRGCEIFVLPSRLEAFGLVLLEAMSFRRPVVATRVGGIPEVVENGCGGILVDPNPTSLASGIEKLLLTPHMRDTFTKKSLEVISIKFSKQNCETTADLIETVFKRSAYCGKKRDVNATLL